MAIQNTRMTFGTILGTVGTAANAVSKVINTGVSGVDMLDNWVTAAKRNQEARMKVDESDYIDQIIEQKAQEQTARQIEIEKYLATSEQHRTLFNDNHTKLQALFADKK